MYNYSNLYANGAKTLYKLTSGWHEDSATWALPWIKKGGDFHASPVAKYNVDTSNIWEEFNVTATVKEIIENSEPNYGFLLKFDDYAPSNGIFYRSSNYNDKNLRPKMSVTYFFDDNEPPTVEVTSPKSGDIWQVGSAHSIQWQSADNHYIACGSLYFSSDNGSSWTLIDSLQGARRSYPYFAPNVISTTCKVKVFVYDGDGNVGFDESDKFTIEQATGISHTLAEDISLLKFKKTKGACMVYVPFSAERILLTDSKGRQLYSGSGRVAKAWSVIPISLSKGIYVISIQHHGQQVNRKVLLTY